MLSLHVGLSLMLSLHVGLSLMLSLQVGLSDTMFTCWMAFTDSETSHPD